MKIINLLFTKYFKLEAKKKGINFLIKDDDEATIKKLLALIKASGNDPYLYTDARCLIFLFLQQREQYPSHVKKFAKDVLNELLTPPKTPKQTKAEQLQQKADAYTKQAALKHFKKKGM